MRAFRAASSLSTSALVWAKAGVAAPNARVIAQASAVGRKDFIQILRKCVFVGVERLDKVFRSRLARRR